MKFNPQDKKIWNEIFSDVPPEWKLAKPSGDMLDCRRFFASNGVESVLDLGCGIGIWSMFLSRAGLRVSGVDFSPVAVEFARGWAIEEGLDIRYGCSPVTETAFPGELFDAVLAAKILDNISEDECRITIANIKTSLAGKGSVFCLFNPESKAIGETESGTNTNPTKGITSISYSDGELREVFADFNILDLKLYPHGFRGLFLTLKA